jgi:hypothetical protein
MTNSLAYYRAESILTMNGYSIGLVSMHIKLHSKVTNECCISMQENLQFLFNCKSKFNSLPLSILHTFDMKRLNGHKHCIKPFIKKVELLTDGFGIQNVSCELLTIIFWVGARCRKSDRDFKSDPCVINAFLT